VTVIHRVGMRTGRTSPPLAERVASRLPAGVKRTLRTRTAIGRPPPEQLERLRHHYAYWREKWGFDLLNPDMAEVRRRYGDTEVCWAYDATMRRAGEEIAATARGVGSRAPGTPSS
jgi:hypothetical protein